MAREWLARLPAEDLRISLLHPPGLRSALPGAVAGHELPLRPGAWGRLRYEQFDLPRAARRLGCDGLLIFDGGAPIAARLPTVALSDEAFGGQRRGAIDALRRAAGRAGRSVTAQVLYPRDGPPAAGTASAARGFAPLISEGFSRLGAEGAQSYVLCHGLRRQQVPLALAAWSWVDGSLGDSYPLLLLGADSDLEQQVRQAAAALDLADSIRFQAELDLQSLPAVYHDAAAVLSLGAPAWGQPLRWALAAGAPVAAVHSQTAGSILSDTGYLAPEGDARALGAACLSLLVQPELADRLRERGRRIAAAYFGEQPVTELRQLLQDSLSG